MSEQYVTADAPTKCAKCKQSMMFLGGEWVHSRIEDFFECNEVKAIPGKSKSQAYIVECEDLVPGDQVWFPSAFEAEHACGPFEFSCCTLKPVGDDYDGPRWVPE